MLALYALAWIVGLRRILDESGHGLSLKALDIDYGLQLSATVPMAAVVRCYDGGVLNGLSAADVWFATPAELPNVVIELAGPTSIKAVKFGRSTTAVTLRDRYGRGRAGHARQRAQQRR